MFKLGLTGGIATGKSTISTYLSSKNIPILDADKIARQVVEPGTPGLAEIVQYFGDDILQDDQTLNRKALGQIVFNDEQALQKLNEITHPRIQQMMMDQVAVLAKSNTPLVILDIPLLLENHNEAGADAVMLVTIPKTLQLERLMNRNHLTQAEAESRIAAQMPLAEKEQLADYIIDNSGSVADTYKQVDQVINQILA
ncbi:dephospho-CoA kinase [Weissella bombi]|uniref:Dephospho-CoA kinase n=1 Tax=Weissella bombi TaxID=1505725 RepID=A0A1C3YV52_9LACO|nr:dephospho-CoA kinase [Weissella bombi]SCB73940.1 dephospho-CoA kinase [Weissella bombi]